MKIIVDYVLLFFYWYLVMFDINLPKPITLLIAITILIILIVLSRFDMITVKEPRYFLLLFIVLLWSFLSVVLNSGNLDFEQTIRPIVIFLNALLLGLFFSAKRSNVGKTAKVVVFLLWLAFLAVVVQVVFPEIKPTAALFVGYTKRIIPLRVFGLTTGYEITSFYILLLMITFFKHDYFGKYILGLLCVLLSFFIGRSGLVLNFLCFSTLLFTHSSKKVIFLYLAFLVVGGFVLASSYGYIVEVSKSSYGYGTVEALTGPMLHIPSTAFELIFGTARDTSLLPEVISSDIGFVNQIYSYGIVGMILLLTVPLMSLHLNKKNLREVKLILLVTFFVLNYKIPFFNSLRGTQLFTLTLFLLTDPLCHNRQWVHWGKLSHRSEVTEPVVRRN